MRINDIIYFSPTVRLDELDLSKQDELIDSFRERIISYYFKPVEMLVKQQHAFAAGALECMLIDAFGRYSSTENGSEKRMVVWCMNNLGVSEKVATDFYKFFRCGLLHESHIKKYGQFCFDEYYIQSAMIEVSDYVVINPKYLLTALQKYLDSFTAKLKVDADLYAAFVTRIKEDFTDEVARAANEKPTVAQKELP